MQKGVLKNEQIELWALASELRSELIEWLIPYGYDRFIMERLSERKLLTIARCMGMRIPKGGGELWEFPCRVCGTGMSTHSESWIQRDAYFMVCRRCYDQVS